MGAVAKKETTEVSTTTELPMHAERIDARDVLLPSLYLMQSNSEWVEQEKAKSGEIVKSTGQQVVAPRDGSIVLVPLAFNKSFRIVEVDGNKWVRNEAFDPGKADEWEITENGKDLKRVSCINVFAYLQEELEGQAAAIAEAQKTGEMPDTSQMALPVMITFRSTGYRAGKEVITHFAMAQKYKIEPYMGRFELSAIKQTNDDGTFYTYQVKPHRGGQKLTPEQVEECKQWRSLMLANAVKVDLSGEGTGETKEATEY